MAEAGASAGMGAAGWVSAAGTIMQIMGQREMGRAARAQADRARAAAEFNAWQADQQAGLTLAISQRQAIEEQRQGRYAASRALAVAAAGGGGASDPTVARLIADASGVASYKSSIALYEGEAKARQLKMEAITGRIGGAEAQIVGAERQLGYAYASFGTGAHGAASLFDKYGLGGPSKKGGDSSLIRNNAGAGDIDMSNLT